MINVDHQCRSSKIEVDHWVEEVFDGDGEVKNVAYTLTQHIRQARRLGPGTELPIHPLLTFISSNAKRSAG